jgi:hypothetical protein
MALFEFELSPVERIAPWEKPPAQHLSWFALTDGAFHMPVGSDVLFRYSPAILAHWHVDEASRDATYQVAAFARDALGSAAAGAAPLPRFFEDIICDAALLRRLRRLSMEVLQASRQHKERDYVAWRWWGERAPWMGYLVAHPRFAFLRVGDDVHVAWDNSDAVVDGVSVWTAGFGEFVLSVKDFLGECRSFSNRLLARMEERIASIAAGEARPIVAVDVKALREQHGTWTRELGEYGNTYTPDIDWSRAEAALREIACEGGIGLPEGG